MTEEAPEIDVSDAPPLRPAGTLRIKQRKAFLAIAMTVDDRQESDGGVPVDKILDLIEDMDDALEAVAVDPAAYAAWAVGGDVESRVATLFMQYAGQLGEAQRSTS